MGLIHLNLSINWKFEKSKLKVDSIVLQKNCGLSTLERWISLLYYAYMIVFTAQFYAIKGQMDFC